jgi:hypothetical protein
VKTQSLYPESPFPTQASATGIRRKIILMIAILAILSLCSFALWEGIRIALRLTSGHS